MKTQACVSNLTNTFISLNVSIACTLRMISSDRRPTTGTIRSRTLALTPSASNGFSLVPEQNA